MIYWCFSCNEITYLNHCVTCGHEHRDHQVPLDIEYYPEFDYRSKGFVDVVFKKEKTQQKMNLKKEETLAKYKKFENPYFVNYVNMMGISGLKTSDPEEDNSLKLFRSVLVQLGFDELEEFPSLTAKILRSTAFRFMYTDFVARTSHHVKEDFWSTVRSWIEERGSGFRADIKLFLYMLYEMSLFAEEIEFNPESGYLVWDDKLEKISAKCENIYFEILVERMKATLENFDPQKYITIHAVDGMDGCQFEEFLGMMFRAIGFDVTITKKSGDQGADLFAEKFGKKIVIQAKNYMDSVGNSAVQQVLAAKAFYGCDEGMVVTNSFFTPSAKELAEASGVKLVSRPELQKYLDDFNRVILEAEAV